MTRMRSHHIVFLVGILVALIMKPSLAQNLHLSSHELSSTTGSAAAANAPWFFDKVDSDDSYPFDDIGQHVSIALHPVSGRPYISYYQASQKILRMAKYVGSGGNCGTNNDWDCVTVDPIENVGMYSSIAFDPTDNAPVIAYFDASNGALKLAEWMGNHWGFTIVHEPSFESGGRYTSLKLDASGDVHVSFYVYRLLGDDSLWYAKYVGGSAGTCTNPNYDCEQIAYTAKGRGKYTSLDLDSLDRPRIAFWEEEQNRLGYAWYNGTWTFRWIFDKTGDGAGKLASLAVDVNNGDLPLIAHYDSINGVLEYATYVGTGGNCEIKSGTFEEWQCDVIDSVGISIDHKGVSIAVDGNGYPVIAYQSG